MRTKLIMLRISKGYTQRTFSDKIGISRSHYSQIETGDKVPSLKVALKMKQTLEYYNDDIFLISDDSKRSPIRMSKNKKVSNSG